MKDFLLSFSLKSLRVSIFLFYFANKIRDEALTAELGYSLICFKKERLAHYPLLNLENSKNRVIGRNAHAWEYCTFSQWVQYTLMRGLLL